MGVLPTGTVTLLFTDVEGSTRLLAEHGDAYSELLAEHRRLLREAFAAHGGAEVDTQGDAFFIAFARATDAASAAVAGQAALARTPVRVRMGAHTGEPSRTDEGYVGMDVHRAARVAAAAHGGQVVVTEQTARLLGDTTLRDLGVHRLKDVGPTRIFQLGNGDFPPLRTLHATNLPIPASPLVGRKKELLDVVRLLAVERARVVTATGPGGIGKTRFALAAGAELVADVVDGVWFVDLSAVQRPEDVLPAVARVLGADADLAGHIADRRLLVLLDNLEHVVEVASGLADLVAACPNLQLLGTSREPLRIAAEREYPLRPLPESPAVELFRQRVAAVAPGTEVDYQVAATICERLDRLPLAIELAAARVKLFEPEALLERLDERLALLTSRARDVPARQRTLHDTIAWSYELLTPEEQAAFARLSVFAGGFSVDGAREVASVDPQLLEGLVDKNLLTRDGDRLGMLGTIREFAAARLEQSGAADEARHAHATFLLGLLELRGTSPHEHHDERYWLAWPERDNVRAALAWGEENDPIAALKLAAALEVWWATFSPEEGMRLLQRLLAKTPDAPEELRARALRACGGAANPAGDDALAERLYQESYEVFCRLGDEPNAVHLLMRLGHSALYRGDLARAAELAQESLSRSRGVGDRLTEAQAMGLVGEVSCAEGNLDEGIALIAASGRLAEELGFTWWRTGMLGSLVDHELERGHYAEASVPARQALALAHEQHDRRRVLMALARLALIAVAAGDAEHAGLLWGAVETEEAHAPAGSWVQTRERFAEPLLAEADDAFERGRSAGRLLSLEAAVTEAVGNGRSEREAGQGNRSPPE